MRSTSTLLHTPASAYLHSILSREQDRPLGLPAYFIPRVRKELLTALVWWLPPASAAESLSATEQSCPCTRLVLLDRSALSDEEVRQVCKNWADQRAAQIERHEQKRRSNLEQHNIAVTATAAGKERDDGDGDFDEEAQLDDHDEGMERHKGGASQGSTHLAAPQHPPPQQRQRKGGRPHYRRRCSSTSRTLPR
ncbi:hypothetical protein LSCM1_05052 [Leishmania martiniquensis]|uniref:Uncharacterized protein n=1 Tax=Leishmania martiniquensis TaxID=1580590 RepID=A0A836KJ47_9TRYP|nr:hypothetical protein LSCM1_05052 [Leishmania martiniquensis]